MDQDTLKQAAAQAALEYTLKHLDYDAHLGIGTGSTCNHFIDLLAGHKGRFAGTVASSEQSAERLKSLGIPVNDLNNVDRVQIYVDGADEVNSHLEMVKGGGAALTREKIVAAAAEQFVCIVDQSKQVDHLGKFPLPVEVIPMARSYVARALVKLGGEPVYRENVVTDNGNMILDVRGLYPVGAAKALEEKINNIAGVVCNGIFALRPADILLVATTSGVETLSAARN